MKKLISLFLALALLLGMTAVPALADDFVAGTLSYLNMTEQQSYELGLEYIQPLKKLLFLHGVWKDDGTTTVIGAPTYRYYDSLDALLMGLLAKEIDCIHVPYYTGRYLCSTNDNLIIREEYHPENANGVSSLALSVVSDGYSFMMKEENAALRDEFDAQITAMKEDGTLQKLVEEHIIKASETGEPVAVAFENFEGAPIKVAVTGSLPPMDYVAADGSFAGFNTAVLAEIGRRLQRNIELVQVDSIGRALALSEGTVDVVFWTRGVSDGLAQILEDRAARSEEEQEALRKEREANLTDDEKAVMQNVKMPELEARQSLDSRDMPEGTITTQPYFSDCPAWVVLK